VLGAVLLGALALAGYFWGYSPGPTEVSFEEFARLVESRQVKSIKVYPETVEGELKIPGEHPGIRDGRFVAPVPGKDALNTVLAKREQGVPLSQVSGPGNPRRPSAWTIVPMLAWPLLVAALFAAPLGSPSWFPQLRPGK
jgi:hypothetical protein